MFYLWRAVAGIPGSFIFYDRDILTFQVAGPEVDAVIAVDDARCWWLAVAVVAVIGGAQGAARSRVRDAVPAALLSRSC